MNRQHVVIISGGTVEENLALDILKKQSSAFLIAVDRGLEFFYEHKIKPDYIVGDFDSIAPEIIAWYKEWTEIPIREFNPVKDASDTEIAVRYAVESGYGNITILGGTGTRLDHVMANIQVLSIPARAGIPAEIIDGHNRIRVVEREVRLKKSETYGEYFSLFPLGGEVRHLYICGAKYPLTDHTLVPYDSLCVSNQIDGEEAVIAFGEGMVILMETREEIYQ